MTYNQLFFYVGILKTTGKAKVIRIDPLHHRDLYLMGFGPYPHKVATHWANYWNTRQKGSETMRRIDRLRKEAMEATKFRGHKMCRYWDGTRLHHMKYCLNCGRQVFIDLYPSPNSIDISGEAVALNCDAEDIETEQLGLLKL